MCIRDRSHRKYINSEGQELVQTVQVNDLSPGYRLVTAAKGCRRNTEATRVENKVKSHFISLLAACQQQITHMNIHTHDCGHRVLAEFC